MTTTDADPNVKGERDYVTIDLAQPSAPVLNDAPVSAIAQTADILPAGWRTAIAADGRRYYINDITKTTQWHKPPQPQSQNVIIVQQPSIYQQPAIQQPQLVYVQQQPMQEMSSPAQTESTPIELTVNPSPAPEPPDPETEDVPPAPKLNEFNFAQLVPDKVSCKEHIILCMPVIVMWLLIQLIILYIVTSRSALLPFIIGFVFINATLFICCNPMYFKSYRYKYHPKYIKDIHYITNDDDEAVSDINPPLSIQENTNKSADVLLTKDTEPYTPPQHTKCGTCQTALVRAVAFVACMGFGWASLTGNEDEGTSGPQIIVLTICCSIIFAFCFSLMSHFAVYYKKKYWRYNLVTWLLFSILTLLSVRARGIYIIVSLALFALQCVCTRYGVKIYKMQILYALDPNVFESAFECNAQCNANDLNQDSDAMKDALQIKSDTRMVGCCCNRIFCGYKTCIRAQVTASAISLWLIFGFIYLDPKPWLIFPMSMYIYCNLVWNPLYYSKIAENIKKRKCCCTCSKWCYYMWEAPAVFIGSVPNTLLLLISTLLVSMDSNDGGVNGTFLMLSAFASVYATAFFYVPATGFCFHTVPVHFVISHLLASLVCFLVPVAVLFDSMEMLVLFSDRGTTVLFSVVIVVTFMSISGASCSCYRFKKTLMETQHYLTTATGFSKGEDTKEVSLTWMRVSTFILTFVDFFTDTIWTFQRSTFRNEFGIFRGIAIFLWLVQVLVQLISANAAINALRRGMLEKDRKTRTVMQKYEDVICRECCGCCFYIVARLIYSIFLIMLSAILSVSKLLAIKQVREWWLSLIIADYDEIKEKSSRGKIEKKETEIVDELMQLVTDTDNKVWKLYYWIESKSPKWMLKCRINAAVYNNYLISELIVESIPLLVLNIVNASDNGWTTMSYVSAISSTMFILYGLLKVAYYVGYKNWDLAKFVL
eukprot:278438_1